MARATVLACDKCGTWDSEVTPVRRVTVAGPKFELCERDRAALLVSVGVPADVATEYQRMINDKVGKTGALPPLSAANAVVAQAHNSDQAEPELTTDVWEGQDAPQGDPNGDPDQTDILTALGESTGTQPRATAPFADDRPWLKAVDASIDRAAEHFGGAAAAADTGFNVATVDATPVERRAKRSPRGK